MRHFVITRFVYFFLRIMNTFHFTSNEDMKDCNLVLWRSRGETRRGEETWEEKKENNIRREKGKRIRRRQVQRTRAKERRAWDKEENIVTESDNSRWLNAVDGRPARECISILLYKTVHAEQKQKKKWDTNVKGTGGRLVCPSTCPPSPPRLTAKD